MEDAFHGCYLRVGDPGPWAGPWAGIARLEMPSGIGRAAAVEAADQAAGFASVLDRDARAPVNLTPIAGLDGTCIAARATRASRCARCGRRCSNATAKDGRHNLHDDRTAPADREAGQPGTSAPPSGTGPHSNLRRCAPKLTEAALSDP